MDTAEVRSQFEFSPVITILRTCGSSPALSGRIVDMTDSEQSSSGIVVVVPPGTEVVDDVVSAHGYAG
jgi:hypothetical protein